MKHFGNTLIVSALSALVLVSCTFGSNFDVDFSSVPDNPNWFKVTSQRETELGDQIPYDCYLPDGIRACEYAAMEAAEADAAQVPEGMARTSSVTATTIVQNLFDFSQRNRVIELSGTYMSVDLDGMPVRLSGKVVLPADGKIKRFVLCSHYTIGSNDEAPSRAFPLESVLVPKGFAFIFPDYLGYGITADQLHPYLVMDVTARNVADMYFAVQPFLEAAGIKPEHPEIMLMGYSQGGATTMAVERYLELFCSDSVQIHRVFAGGGPYDVLATYDRFVSTDVAGYPVAVPLVMQGMIKGNRLNLKMEDLVKPFVYEKLDDWVNSKTYSTAQINSFINTTVTHEILTEKGMDRTSDEVSELYKAMTNNSILSYSWTPQAPVYILHSIDDEVVTFTNAYRAREKWQSANVQYNFGHYGTHIKGCLRFIYSVRTLLEEEDEEGLK